MHRVGTLTVPRKSSSKKPSFSGESWRSLPSLRKRRFQNLPVRSSWNRKRKRRPRSRRWLDLERYRLESRRGLSLKRQKRRKNRNEKSKKKVRLRNRQFRRVFLLEQRK
jgi:hypothetical protein